VDGSPTLLAAAREADPVGPYVLGDAQRLPFADRSFDLAVAYNCLMDVDDMSAATREIARVLEPGGHLSVSVTHPINDAGRFSGREPEAPFVIGGSYLGERRRFEATEERDGLTMTFRGWCYPLEEYTRALEEAGFLIERVREPAASAESLAKHGPSDIRWQRVPLFLQIRAVKR
jgi:SAM-dependent methyltransferase